jgi:hypothetical protein
VLTSLLLTIKGRTFPLRIDVRLCSVVDDYQRSTVGPSLSGIFPDFVGMGVVSSQPYDGENPEHQKQASNVIQTGVSKPTNETRRQTLTTALQYQQRSGYS